MHSKTVKILEGRLSGNFSIQSCSGMKCRPMALSKPEHNIVRIKTIKREKEKEDVSHEEVKRGVEGEQLKVEE